MAYKYFSIVIMMKGVYSNENTLLLESAQTVDKGVDSLIFI